MTAAISKLLVSLLIVYMYKQSACRATVRASLSQLLCYTSTFNLVGSSEWHAVCDNANMVLASVA